MIDSKKIEEFVLALNKLKIEELMGVAELLHVNVWTEPQPVEHIPTDCAGEQSNNTNSIGEIPTDCAAVANTSPIIQDMQKSFNAGDTNMPGDGFSVDGENQETTTNPFKDVDRPRPRDGQLILAEMCEAYAHLSRPNRRHLLKIIKTAGAK